MVICYLEQYQKGVSLKTVFRSLINGILLTRMDKRYLTDGIKPVRMLWLNSNMIWNCWYFPFSYKLIKTIRQISCKSYISLQIHLNLLVSLKYVWLN